MEWAKGFSSPVQMAYYKNYMYVSNYSGNSISKININDPINDNTYNWISLLGPASMIILDDNLYVVNNFFSISKINLSNKTQNIFITLPFGTYASSLASDGIYIYVSYSTNIARVRIIDANLELNWFINLPSFTNGSVIVNNNLYITNNDSVIRININDINEVDYKWYIDNTGINGITNSGDNSKLYISNFNDNRIIMIPIENKNYAIPNFKNTNLKNPSALIEIKNYLYVINTTLSNIVRFYIFNNKYFKLPLFTNNSQVYYKKHSYSSSAGTVRNSRVKKQKT